MLHSGLTHFRDFLMCLNLNMCFSICLTETSQRCTYKYRGNQVCSSNILLVKSIHLCIKSTHGTKFQVLG